MGCLECFFFSSRRRHTRLVSDWSSDVCSSDLETRVLASGGRNEGDDSDRAFLELFAESAGRHFGIEMAGGAPRSVRSPFPRELLIDAFVNLFEVTGTEET